MEVEVDDRQQTGTWKLVSYSADNNLVASKCVCIGSTYGRCPYRLIQGQVSVQRFSPSPRAWYKLAQF